MAVNQTKELEMGLFFFQERKKPKVIEVDVTKASLTHAIKRLKYIKGFFLSSFPFRFAIKKLLPLQHLVKSKLSYLLEVWRYEQNKGAECP